MITSAKKPVVLAVALLVVLVPGTAFSQHSHDHGATTKTSTSAAEKDSSVTAGTDHAMNGKLVAGLHVAMTPDRPPTAGDSARAASIARELRASIAKYKDVRVAVKDGYRQFAPGVKGQKVLHFTRGRSAVRAVFSFDAAQPTSLLYRPVEGGDPVLIGAMYTAPRRSSLEDLDQRVPLSVAKWHRHINFCLPPVRQKERWKETQNGLPVFGPLSPIATEEECDKVGGRFYPQVFGWMVHANVFESDDPAIIWGDDHRTGHTH